MRHVILRRYQTNLQDTIRKNNNNTQTVMQNRHSVLQETSKDEDKGNKQVQEMNAGYKEALLDEK